MTVQKMNDEAMIMPGGWVSRAMRPVREDNNGQFDDCEAESPSECTQKKTKSELPFPVSATEYEAEQQIKMISSEAPLNMAYSESGDGVSAFDVLSGRGGGTNNHPGNQYFRRLCDQCRPKYVLARKMEKREIARDIVATVRARGGRFLKKDEKTGNWYDIGDAKATSKTSQALREGLASKMRQALLASGAPKVAQAMMASANYQTPLLASAEQEMPPLEVAQGMMVSEGNHTPLLAPAEQEMPPLPPLPHDTPDESSSSRIHLIDEPSSECMPECKRQRVSI